MDTILLSSKPIEISEYKTYKEAIFLISVLDEWDLNNRLIPKSVGEKYHKTIIGFPIVAKLIRDKDESPIDFRGHEMKIIQDEYGNTEYKFDTFPIGSVLDSWIEQREVSGYNGLKDCIMIKCKLWSDRFPEYFEVLDKLWAKNNVKSSWELTVEKYQKTIRGKIIQAFSFLGNALLGSDIQGAVPGAGVYEYAENSNENFDTNELFLASALSSDCIKISDIKTEEQEENISVSKTKKEVTEEDVKLEEVNKTNVTKITETSEDEKEKLEENLETEISSLTMKDLREKLQSEVTKKIKYGWVVYIFPAENYCLIKDDSLTYRDLEYLKLSYSVDNDEIILGEPEKVTLAISISEINTVIAAKDNALEIANEKINTLESEILELKVFKEQMAEIEKNKAEKEFAEKKENLKAYAINSKQITEEELESDEIITKMISELDESGIKSLISDRFVASLLQSKEKKVEVSEVNYKNAKADLDIDDESFDAKLIIKNFLGK